MRYLTTLMLCLATCISGCGSDNSNNSNTEESNFVPPGSAQIEQMLSQNRAVPDNRISPHYKILLFGNSHMRSHNFSGVLSLLLQSGQTGQQATVAVAPGWDYLDVRLQQKASMALLTQQSWTHLVLQGQKYSVSQSVAYPTTATRYLVELAKSQQTTPILYAEHAMKGNFSEGDYIYSILQTIQQQQHACLAPVPHAWRLTATSHPELQLHEQDGNHASLSGVVLSAMVLYEMISGAPADQLPYLPKIALPAMVQQQLRQQASASLQQYPPCPL